jgi:hypothetical protein
VMLLLLVLMQLVVVVMMAVVGVVCERGHWIRDHAPCKRTHRGDGVCVDRVEGVHDGLLLVI